jgi:phosphate starvation-inducible protein PhoH and related proteins
VLPPRLGAMPLMDVLVRVPPGDVRAVVLGSGDRNLKMIREALGVHVTSRNGNIKLSGSREAVAAARDVIHRLQEAAQREEAPSRQHVLDIINWAASRRGPKDDQGDGAPEALGEFQSDDLVDDSGPAWGQTLDVYVAGRPVRASTINQQAYLDAIRDNDMVFAIGPAGTGKTYLAVAAAVHLLKVGRVRKVILVRPAVEAGEKLGFLPGDLQAKVNPYLRPLFDALHDMMDFGTIKKFVLSDVVEVVPLAYMRGRTLNRSCIILDEAQNTTRTQMKMFLTRMGQGSKIIVTGDATQIDLPDPTQSGLIDAARRLRNVPGIGWAQLDERDIVRHSLVQRVVEAYGTSENERRSPAPPRPGRARSDHIGPIEIPDQGASEPATMKEQGSS